MWLVLLLLVLLLLLKNLILICQVRGGLLGGGTSRLLVSWCGCCWAAVSAHSPRLQHAAAGRAAVQAEAHDSCLREVHTILAMVVADVVEYIHGDSATIRAWRPPIKAPILL